MGDKVTLQALAKRVDTNDMIGNKNGKLDGENEIKFFDWDAKKEGYSEEEIQRFKQENGLAVAYTTKPAEAGKPEAAQTPVTASESKTGNKKYDKELYPAFRAKVDEAVKQNKVPEYKKIADELAATQKSNDKETKEALGLLESRAKREAYAKAIEINQNLKGKTKEARRSQMRNMSKDEYFRDAIQDIKVDRKVLARQEVVTDRKNEIKDVTKEELNRELSKHFLGMRTGGGEELANKLGAYKKADGKYDLSALSDDVISRIGFDYALNRGDRDLEMSEIKNLKEHLKWKTGQDFTNNEIKRLVKYVGAKVEPRERSIKKLAEKLLVGEAIGITSGALGGYMAKHGDLKVTQTTNVTVDVNQSQSIINQLKNAGVEYTTSTSKDGVHVVINILQQVIKNDRQWNAIMGALGGAAIGALPALAYLAFGGDRDEKSCVSVSDFDRNDTKYTDLEQYKKYVDQRFGHNPVKADAMKELAQQCYNQTKGTDTKWYDVYHQIIRDMAGIGSKLNPEECIGFKYQKTPAAPQEPQKPTPTTQEPEKTYVVRELCSDDSEETQTISQPEVQRVPWEVMAARYDCLDEHLAGIKNKQAYKTRMVKVMQSVTDNNYTLENLKKLTDISLKSNNPNTVRANFKDVKGFDVENYIKNLQANTIGKQKIPAIKINDTVECKYNPNIKYTVKVTNGKSTGTSSHTGDSRTQTIPGDKKATITTSDGQTYTYGKNEKEQFKMKIQELGRKGYKGSGNDADCYVK